MSDGLIFDVPWYLSVLLVTFLIHSKQPKCVSTYDFHYALNHAHLSLPLSLFLSLSLSLCCLYFLYTERVHRFTFRTIIFNELLIIIRQAPRYRG